MAVVPILRENNARLRPLATPELRAAQGGDALTGLAEGLQRLGDAGERYAVDQDRIDATLDEGAAKEADAELSGFHRELLYTGENSFFSKQGSNALNARKGAEDALRQKQAEIAGRLTSPRQQRLFEQVATRRTSEALEGIGRYAVAQTQVYERAQSQARSDQATQDAVLHADDPEKFTAAIGTIRLEALSQANREGLQGEPGEIVARKAVSDAVAAVVEGKSTSDPLTAQRFLELHRDQIDPTTQIKLDRMLHAPLLDQWADEKADVLRGVGGFDPAPSTDALVRAVTGQESGGRTGLVSSAGARGVMQVMPGTAKQICADLGIAYDPERLRADPAYCTRIGTAYLQQMLKRYGGNSTLALAAYNAGPGRVDEWIKANGDPRKGQIGNAEWAARIPIAETREYVPGVLRRVGGGGPRNIPRENDVNAQLSTVDRIADEQGWTREQRGAVKQKVLAGSALDERMLRDQQSKAEEDVWSRIGAGATSLRQIPPKLFDAMSETGKRQVRGALEAAAKPEPVKTDPAFYAEIGRVAAIDPKAFAAINPVAYRHKLDEGDWKHFVELRNGVLSGKPTAATVSDQSIMSAVDDRLHAAGIPTGDNKEAAKPANAARIAAFQRSMRTWVSVFKAQNGREPNDQEIGVRADRMLIQARFDGAGDKSFAFEAPDLRQAQLVVPDDIARRIRREAGDPNLSNADVTRVFVHFRGIKW